MKTTNKGILYLLVISILFAITGCGQGAKKPSPQSENQQKPMPKTIEEIENDAIKIMQLADLVPYFEKAIKEKEAKEQQQKEEKAQQTMAQGSGQGGGQGDGQAGDQGGGQQEQKGEEEQKEPPQPQPRTLGDVILTEVLMREKTGNDSNQMLKPPEDITETWKEINTTIKALHDKWNILEPVLIEENIPPETISGFENTLDTLTAHGMQNKYFETLSTANLLTSHLPKFMGNFKKDVPPTVYSLKFLVRNVVITAASENYQGAQDSLDKIKEQSQSVKSKLIEKKAKSTADKFDASVGNLQKSVEKKDLNLVKINASIVMKNVGLMRDDLAGSI
ncbi:hypothetical protein [Geosporobacter ferrireducens]|uniref:Lipoprotein n=1 Tax=Geosporobacter ferrireducens TaxID=1424294 RepID=A0A1D8GCG5_9FIRM|nr:hypothetical protein [Geosporobacter ferrireducens]AOT68596.1 hypothetical protein Gferi_02680 [Geosporobacter ferrireducens]MTI54065.1 hypothetical protein [Geosporobacter ferrireducens]